MSWIRTGDEWNSAPEWGRAFELALQRDDTRLVTELKGATHALFTFSAQQWTDYKIRFGEAALTLGHENAKRIIADLVAIGVLFPAASADNEFVLLERENFVHLIRSDEKKKAAKRKRDQNRASLQVPVLLRDGDSCRYCGEGVIWGDTRSDFGRTFDHRNIEEETTPDNYVVACKGCNQLRSEFGDSADEELPLLDSPEHPIYGKELVARLSKWPRVVERETARLGIPNPLKGSDSPATSQPVKAPRPTEPSTPSTPAPAPAGNQPAGERPLPSNSEPTPTRSSRHVDVKGRAGNGAQPRRQASRTNVTQSTPSASETLAQPAQERPQDPSGAHVRAPEPANEAHENARKRPRNRRRGRRPQS